MVKQLVPLAFVLLAIWLYDRWSWYRWRRRKYHEMFDADDARHEAWEAERRREEAERTRWLPQDSGYVFNRIPGTYRTDPTKPQPWSFHYLWQGLVHSSSRPQIEEGNAVRDKVADDFRKWWRSLRSGTARQTAEGKQE